MDLRRPLRYCNTNTAVNPLRVLTSGVRTACWSAIPSDTGDGFQDALYVENIDSRKIDRAELSGNTAAPATAFEITESLPLFLDQLLLASANFARNLPRPQVFEVSLQLALFNEIVLSRLSSMRSCVLPVWASIFSGALTTVPIHFCPQGV